MKNLPEAVKLHIVSFDIPYPPDYGGAIDVFYKVKNLSEAGVEIFLHCPQYAGRKPSEALERLCKKVFYYPRKSGLNGVSLKYPYTVYSRRDKQLLHNLIRVEAPVFFDGISTAFYLSHPALRNRLKILRPQNVEQDYFLQLAGREKNLIKKLYYFLDSVLLKNFENRLKHADAFFTVAMHDHDFFKKKYPEAFHQYLPSFQPYNHIESLPGRGGYCLYHGNLGLAENKEAALFLLKKIIPESQLPFVIAGRNPDEQIFREAQKYPHCRIIANPSAEEMEELIKHAQMHVLPTFQNTGLKLKLLHALFNGRFVLVNKAMVFGTGLEKLCDICADEEEFLKNIRLRQEQFFGTAEIDKRKTVLCRHYNNPENAQAILRFLQQRLP